MVVNFTIIYFIHPPMILPEKNISVVIDIVGRQDSILLTSKLVHKEKEYSDWFAVRVVQIFVQKIN